MGDLQPESDALVDIEMLLTRRVALQQRLAAIRADLGRGLDRDSSERAVELENADVLNEIARVAEVELTSIDERLTRARRLASDVH